MLFKDDKQFKSLVIKEVTGEIESLLIKMEFQEALVS